VSWVALNWARDQTKVSGSPYVVLLVLADAADRDGMCWPSRRTLARWAHVSTGSVTRALDVLVSAGLVEVTRGRGRRSNRYRVSGAGTEPLDACGKPASGAGTEPLAVNGQDRSGAILSRSGAVVAPDYVEPKELEHLAAHARDGDELLEQSTWVVDERSGTRSGIRRWSSGRTERFSQGTGWLDT
jgi:DNA-binding PadR family transcriptional regulator